MQNKTDKMQKEEKQEDKDPVHFAYGVQRHNMQDPAANRKLH